MRKWILISLMLLLVADGMAQKQTTSFNQVWFGISNQTRFSVKWGTWTDIQLRTREDFLNGLNQGLYRFGLTYYLNNDTKLTAGYAFVNFYPQDSHPGTSQPEHRPWQQIQWHTKYSRLRLMQWVRLDERFRRKIQDANTLGSGYNFNYRVRYNLYLATPLGKNEFTPRSLSFVANDEVHINFGKEIVYNYFDQNRFFVGFAYHVNAHDNLQFGYMNVFQQLAPGNRYKSLNVVRVFYFQNLDLRKSKK